MNAQVSPAASPAAAVATEPLLREAILHRFPGRIALVSSFGADAAVLLHHVACIDPSTPVIFVDSGKLFGETLRHRDRLVGLLSLTDVRSVGPDADAVRRHDAAGDLWLRDPDACCALRKVEPLRRALAPFDAWINGRKRADGGSRSLLPAVELVDGRVKLNPLADWDEGRVRRYIADHGLPEHPLVADSYRSIGCMPCTDRVVPGEGARAGRWRGQAKSECGIHLPGPPAAAR